MREAIKRDKVPYDLWVKQGLITATDGDYIDMEWIRQDILESAGVYNIRECGCDPHRATELMTKLEDEGMNVCAVRQGHLSLLPGVNALELKVSKAELMHGGNPVLRWMASNTTTRSDANGNVIPDKQNSYSRIDGISALINAMTRAIVAGADEKCVYEEHGVHFV